MRRFGVAAVFSCGVGCSSTTASNDVPTSPSEGGAPNVADASAVEDAASTSAKLDGGRDANAPTPQGTCPAPIGAFPESEYFHPIHALSKGACSATDLDTLTKIGLGSFAARRNMVSASCAACVYSDVADAEWGLLIVVDPDTALTNYAGCSILAGDARACVKMNSAWRFCTRKACSQCSGASRNSCAEAESLTGQCKQFYEDDAACSGSFPAGCTSADEMIAKFCG